MIRILILLTMLLPCSVSLAQAAPITLKSIAQDGSLVKYDLTTDSMPGICREIVKKIEKTDPSIRFFGLDQVAPLARIEKMLEKGEIDVFFCMLKSPERSSKFNFILVPLYKVKHVVAVRMDDPVSVKSFNDIRELGDDGLVLVSHGSALVKILRSEKLKVDDNGQTDQQNILKLVTSRGRFCYGHDRSLAAAIKNLKLEKKVKILKVAFKEEPLYLVTSKSLAPFLVNKLKNHLEKMEKSGYLEQTAAKYR